jgi:hypothetical protein
MPVSRKSTLLLLLAALACGGDEPEPAGAPPADEEGAQEVLMEAPQPVLTPAESTAAVAARARHADSMTRAVMGDVPKPAAPPRETIEDQIALCRTQAGQAVGSIREHLLAACERLEARRENPQ